MKTATINGKKYEFVFNGNTVDLYYQVFSEDLITLTLEAQKDKTIFYKNNRLLKLGYITNQQATKGIMALWGKLNIANYLEWAAQFEAGAFMTNEEAVNAVLGGWTDSFMSEAKVKNPDSPQ